MPHNGNHHHAEKRGRDRDFSLREDLEEEIALSVAIAQAHTNMANYKRRKLQQLQE